MSALCPSSPAEGKAVLEQIIHNAVCRRVPLSGAIELTERCNLRCRHCYLGSRRGPLDTANCDPDELPASRMLPILDEAIAEGCLFMTLTGGEPLLRPDFAIIYRHLRERGVLLTVFTNGTRLTAEHCELFTELPPDMVEVSLYGATAATYEAVTQVPGSFSRCLSGIERLLEAGVRVSLKTVLLTTNRHELKAMRERAKAYDVPFRFDTAVCASFDGDLAPLEFRLSPEEAVSLELADDVRREQWRTHYRRLKAGPMPNGLYGCGAGVDLFFLDAHGKLFPCLMAHGVSDDAAARGFSWGWWNTLPKLFQLEAGGMDTCNRCPSRGVCDVCPGFVALETGVEDGRSDYLCAVGKARDAYFSQLTLLEDAP